MARSRKDVSPIETKPQTPVMSAGSLVFISHDTRDAQLAESFSKLLSSVSCGVLKSFRTSDRSGTQGIEYGVEWYPEIMKKLENASDVVCILTQRSIDRPWILYEAGVAKGKMDTPVHGLALGIPLSRAITGPFAQFHNSDDDVESITKLVMQLVRKIPNAEPDHDAIEMQVVAFKETVTSLLKESGEAHASETPPKKVDETSVAKLFEEVKVMFQDLPGRVEKNIAQAVEPTVHRRSRHFHPRMFEELLMHGEMQEVARETAWLVFISFYRDQAPWLYELGLRVYRAFESKRGIARAVNEFRKCVRMMMQSEIGHEFFRHSKDGMMMMDAAEMMADRFMHLAGEDPDEPHK